MAILVKPNMTKAKAAALAESDEEAVDGFATPLSCGWQRKYQRLFLWKRPVNGSAKTGRTETSRQRNNEMITNRIGLYGIYFKTFGL